MKSILFAVSMMIFGQAFAGALFKVDGKVESLTKKEVVLVTSQNTRMHIDRMKLAGERGKVKSKGQQLTLWVPMHAITKEVHINKKKR